MNIADAHNSLYVAIFLDRAHLHGSALVSATEAKTGAHVLATTANEAEHRFVFCDLSWAGA